ncbi:MAG TPA: carboxypeptidase-like regulatory domain-containing protein [Gemmatimonadales bacterium]|nr:carboxypeptidase-like regulatory domain-containing protein [Gemmatimonadales bacterium]
MQPPRIPRTDPAVRAPVAAFARADTVRVAQRDEPADSASRQADAAPLRAQLRGRSEIGAAAPQAAAVPPAAAPAAVLEGRVLAKSGAAIGNAIVRVEGTALTASVRADGSYRLEGDLPPDASIVARALGFRPERKRVTLGDADSGRVDFALEQDATRLEELVVSGVAERASQRALAAAPARPAPSYRSIGFPEALRLLGGRIRLVDGLVPERLEAAGDTVRVAYRVGPARQTLYLQQFRIGDTVAFVLLSPPGFPADSIARLTARVKP